jgi:hypothetical protein
MPNHSKIYGYQLIGNDSQSGKAATNRQADYNEDTFCPKNEGKGFTNNRFQAG